jgi:hypothetical protein
MERPISNQSRTIALVLSVLSAIPTYLMTSFALCKWATKRIDRIYRDFLWKSSEEARGGHCIVNWTRVNRTPQNWEDWASLARFDRALRLRWWCFKWRRPEKPWEGMQTDHTAKGRQQFKVCTVILVGNGEKTNFCKIIRFKEGHQWISRWPAAN